VLKALIRNLLSRSGSCRTSLTNLTAFALRHWICERVSFNSPLSCHDCAQPIKTENIGRYFFRLRPFSSVRRPGSKFCHDLPPAQDLSPVALDVLGTNVTLPSLHRPTSRLRSTLKPAGPAQNTGYPEVVYSVRMAVFKTQTLSQPVTRAIRWLERFALTWHMLLFHPTRFVQLPIGLRRAHYVSPWKFYVPSTLLMTTVFSFIAYRWLRHVYPQGPLPEVSPLPGSLDPFQAALFLLIDALVWYLVFYRWFKPRAIVSTTAPFR